MENNKLDCGYCIYKKYWDNIKTKIMCNSCNDFSNFKEIANLSIKDNKNYKPTFQLSLNEVLKSQKAN